MRKAEVGAGALFAISLLLIVLIFVGFPLIMKFVKSDEAMGISLQTGKLCEETQNQESYYIQILNDYQNKVDDDLTVPGKYNPALAAKFSEAKRLKDFCNETESCFPETKGFFEDVCQGCRTDKAFQGLFKKIALSGKPSRLSESEVLMKEYQRCYPKSKLDSNVFHDVLAEHIKENNIMEGIDYLYFIETNIENSEISDRYFKRIAEQFAASEDYISNCEKAKKGEQVEEEFKEGFDKFLELVDKWILKTEDASLKQMLMKIDRCT